MVSVLRHTHPSEREKSGGTAQLSEILRVSEQGVPGNPIPVPDKLVHLHFSQWRKKPKARSPPGFCRQRGPPHTPRNFSGLQAGATHRPPGPQGTLQCGDCLLLTPRSRRTLRRRPLWREGRLCGGCSKPRESPRGPRGF